MTKINIYSIKAQRCYGGHDYRAKARANTIDDYLSLL